ncbi:MAG: FAD:protein FMN transferase [Clostridia bacterium]|nr:FAD:protein FMN transferase [Clostridia bacterium]
MKRALSVFLVLLLLLGCLNGCEGQLPTPKEKSYFSYFDTLTTVISYACDDEAVFNANCAAVEQMFIRYHKLFDIYNAYDGINNLYTVNQMAGVAPVAVEKELIDFLLYAKEVYTLTRGETNVMLGAVLSLWHDCREQAGIGVSALPDEGALTEAAKHTAIESLVIDEAEGTVFITDSMASLDVGALGKGYAAERAAEHLRERGAEGYVLDVGGNLRAIGAKPNGDGWITGVTDPLGEGGYLAKLTFSNASLVTSGNYLRYFVVDGKKYHHVIDKDTLYPAEGFASVTVYTADSGLADALSTALFCMTYEDGVSLLATLPDTDALWVTKSGEIKMTEGMTQRLLP